MYAYYVHSLIIKGMFPQYYVSNVICDRIHMYLYFAEREEEGYLEMP